MTDQSLQETLAEIASQAHSVDLYQRALDRSGQIGRRRAAASAVGTAFALLLVVVLVWQAAPRQQSAPVPPASVTSPAPHESASPSPTHTADAPPPRVRELDSGTFRFPTWPQRGDLGGCGTGPVTLTDGQWSGGGNRTIGISESVRGSLDGTPAYFVNVECFGPGEGGVAQVVAYRKAKAGVFQPIAVVARTVGDVHRLGAIGLPAPGRVTVTVAHQMIVGSAPPHYSGLVQTRTYAWNGQSFTQTGGPTSFTIDKSSSRLTATPSRLVVGAAVDGCRTGTMTIQVTNQGPQEAQDVQVAAVLPDLGDADPGPCQIPTGQGYASVLVPVGTLNPGSAVTVTLTVVFRAVSAQQPQVVDEPWNELFLVSGGQQRWPGTTHFVIEYS